MRLLFVGLMFVEINIWECVYKGKKLCFQDKYFSGEIYQKKKFQWREHRVNRARSSISFYFPQGSR